MCKILKLRTTVGVKCDHQLQKRDRQWSGFHFAILSCQRQAWHVPMCTYRFQVFFKKSSPRGLITTAVYHQQPHKAVMPTYVHIIHVPPPPLSPLLQRDVPVFFLKGHLEICAQASINISPLTTWSNDSLGCPPVFTLRLKKRNARLCTAV